MRFKKRGRAYHETVEEVFHLGGGCARIRVRAEGADLGEEHAIRPDVPFDGELLVAQPLDRLHRTKRQGCGAGARWQRQVSTRARAQVLRCTGHVLSARRAGNTVAFERNNKPSQGSTRLADVCEWRAITIVLSVRTQCVTSREVHFQAVGWSMLYAVLATYMPAPCSQEINYVEAKPMHPFPRKARCAYVDTQPPYISCRLRSS